MNIIYKYILFSCVFLINTTSIIATNLQEKHADSLLEVATNNVYKDSNKAIEIALSIFNNTANSAILRTRALMIVSSGYNSKRNYKKALEYIIIAKEFSSQIDDKKTQIGILFSIGLQYQQLKIYDKAIEYMEDVEERALIYPNRDSIGKILADSYLVKGFIYKDNLNCNIALEYFKKGIKEYERLGNSIYNLSIGYYNEGNCYISLSEYANAKKSFNKAIELAQQKNASSLVSFAQKGLAEVYTLEGKYEDAIILLQSAHEKSKDVGDLVLNQSIYKGLFENYLALNNRNDYQKYYDLYLKTQLGIKISERESISISIDDIFKVHQENQVRLKNNYLTKFKWSLIVPILIIIGTVLIKRKNGKTIKMLKNKIKEIQNSKTQQRN